MVPVRTAVLTALILASAFAHAEDVSPAQLADYEKGFGALQQSTKTFSAAIRQTLSLQGLAHPVISEGMLYYSAPDRLLLRFSQPAGEWMIVNGTQVAVQKQGKPLEVRDTSTQGKKSAQAASLLDFFRSGPERWHKNFDVSMTREGDHLFVHLKPWMTPTSTFQGVDSIVTTLQLPSYEVLTMEISMNGSNGVRYEFSNVKRNTPLDPVLFTVWKEIKP